LEHAELVAPGVAHDPEVKAALLLVVIAGRAECLQALDLSLNIVGLQVQVHPVLGDLLVVGALEQHPDLGVRKPEPSIDVAAPLGERLLGGVQGGGPEADRTVEADLHRGAWTDPKLGRITLAEWARRWQATTTNLRPTTRDLYAYLLRRFLLPTFGKAALSSIDVLAVRAWLAQLQDQGVSASTRAKAYRLLSRVLGAAVEAGYLVRNPCAIKGAGQERAPEMRFATVAQVAVLADAIGPRYRALVLVAAYGGLRRASWSACASSGWTCCLAG
jgi:hypothetical protein